MSNKNRNPFKMRASEKIESDHNFLRLFSPEALSILLENAQKVDLFDNVVFIRSSPGAGKTSLLRVFEPGPLGTIFNHRSQDHHKELYSILKKLNVMSSDQVEVLGVTIRCTRNYEILEDLNIEKSKRIRYFYSLLNARVVLATLRSILELRRLDFPEDLHRISFEYHHLDNYSRTLKAPSNGKELFEWASGVEFRVYEALDSFLPIEDFELEGHDELFAPSILTPSNLKVDGQPFCSRILFMVDDAHKLSTVQRRSLFNYVLEKRGNFSIWISERLEAQLGDARNPGERMTSFAGRDYGEINLEQFWGDKNNASKFRKVLEKIAVRRAGMSNQEVDSFQENLADDLDEHNLKSKIQTAIANSLKKIEVAVKHSSKFSTWLDYLNENDINSFKRATLLRQSEILIERDKEKDQLSFEFPLGRKELTEKLDSNLENAAKLFLSRDHGIPYYYGFSDLALISSNNIEQFLAFAADLFEGMLANKISATDVQLDAVRQENIIRNVVNCRYEELRLLLPNSGIVLNFLGNLGAFFNEKTFKPTASYAPGVTGFAITPDKRSLSLADTKESPPNSVRTLTEVIDTCLAFNLLDKEEVTQGKIGQKWEVYYLSRWLCVKFNLPLARGGWNRIRQMDLLKMAGGKV